MWCTAKYLAITGNDRRKHQKIEEIIIKEKQRTMENYEKIEDENKT